MEEFIYFVVTVYSCFLSIIRIFNIIVSAQNMGVPIAARQGKGPVDSCRHLERNNTTGNQLIDLRVRSVDNI